MLSHMPKLDLKEWAALGELIGTIAVVVSLGFVVFSLNQNTDALHGATENIVFELHADLANKFISDESLAAILVKKRSSDPQLTDIEAVRWEKYELNMLDIWTLAFTRYNRGLLSDEQWQAWDVYFTGFFLSGDGMIEYSRWQELEHGFSGDFWHHVNMALFSD